MNKHISNNLDSHPAATDGEDDLYLTLSRVKASQRLRDKRNMWKHEEIKDYETEQCKSFEFRNKWIKKLKTKRENELKWTLERNTVLRALYESPHIFDGKGYTLVRSHWKEIMPEYTHPSLAVDTSDMDIDNSSNEGPVMTSLSMEGGAEKGHNNINEDISGPPDMQKYASMSLVNMAETHITPVTSAFLRRTLSVDTRRPLNGPSALPGNTRLRSFSDSHGLLSKYIPPPKITPALGRSGTDGALGLRYDQGDVSGKSNKHSGSPSAEVSGTQQHGRLIDCLFLVGPNKDDVDEFLEQVSRDITSAEEMVGTDGVSTSADTVLNTSQPYPSPGTLSRTPSRVGQRGPVSSSSSASAVTKQTKFLAPALIFMTSHDPHLELEETLITRFCFPSGIETSVAVTPCCPPTSALPSPLTRRLSIRSSSKRATAPAAATRASISGYNPSMLSSPLTTANVSGSAGTCARFAFLLTSNSNSQQFVVCMTIPRVIFCNVNDKAFAIKTQYCINLVTHNPFFLFFFQLLTEFVNMKGLLSDSAGIVQKQEPGEPIYAELRQLESFALKLLRETVPRPGKTLDLSLTVNMIRKEFSFRRLVATDMDEENCIGTLMWALPVLLKSLPIDLILLALGCALTEMKIVIRSSNLEVLSACVLSLLHLLRPIQWVGPVIVITPPNMHDLLEAPVPVFLGLESTPRGLEMSSGLIVVDPKRNKIHMHPSDVVLSHTLSLPHASKLQQALKPIVENILKLSHKLRKGRRRSSNSTSKTEEGGKPSLSEAASIVAAENDTESMGTDISAPNRGLPTNSRSSRRGFSEGDVSSADEYGVSSPLLTGAIISFVDVMREHMQKIVNTAVQMRWEAKMQRRQQRSDLINAPKEKEFGRTLSDGSIGSMSDASSISQQLPQVNKTSAYFPRQSMGSSATEFMNKFQETQMFCAYCEKHAQTNETISEILSHGNGTAPENDGVLVKAEDDSHSTSSLMSHDSGKCDGEIQDPLVLLFAIMISGTNPMSVNKLSALQKMYENVYSDKKVGIDEMPAGLDISASIDPQFKHGESNSRLTLGPHVLSNVSGLASSVVDEEVLWCNGRCNGAANTPSCTNICIQMWEQRVQSLRRQAAALDIVRGDSSVLAPGSPLRAELGSLASIPSRVKLPSGKVLEVNSIRVDLPKRHSKETESQYIHRASLVTGRDEKDIVEELEEQQMSPFSTCRRDFNAAETRKSSNYATILSSHNNSRVKPRKKHSTVAAIVAYRKIKKKVRFQEIRVRYIRNWAAVVIQKYVRGLIVRSNMEVIVTSLLERKREATIEKTKVTRARGVLRNWIQKSFNKLQSADLTDDKTEVVETDDVDELPPEPDTKIVQPPEESPSIPPVNYVKRHASTGVIKLFDPVPPAPVYHSMKHSRSAPRVGVNSLQNAVSNASLVPMKGVRPDGTLGTTMVPVMTMRSDKSIGNPKQFDNGNLKAQESFESIVGSPMVDSPASSVKSGLLGGLIPANVEHKGGKGKTVLSPKPSFNSTLSDVLKRRKPGTEDVVGLQHKDSLGVEIISDCDDREYSPAKPLDEGFLEQCDSFPRKESTDDIDLWPETNAAKNVKKPATEDRRKSMSSLDSAKTSPDGGTRPQTSPKHGVELLLPIREESTVSSVKGSSPITTPAVDSDNNYDDSSPRSRRISHHRSLMSDGSFDFGSVEEVEVPPCLTQLGPMGAELLTYNQKQCIIDMWNRLRNGILVLKHGRSGKPKRRALYCDDSLAILYWREVGRIDSDKEHTHNTRVSLSSSVASASEAAMLESHNLQHMLDQSNRKSTSRRRSSFSVFSKLDSTREVALKDVLEVRDDMTTDVMKRSVSKKYVDEHRNPSLVISIIMKDRTLDFEIEEMHWGPVYVALQILVDFYQVRCKGKSASLEYNDPMQYTAQK